MLWAGWERKAGWVIWVYVEVRSLWWYRSLSDVDGTKRGQRGWLRLRMIYCCYPSCTHCAHLHAERCCVLKSCSSCLQERRAVACSDSCARANAAAPALTTGGWYRTTFLVAHTCA